VRTRKPLMRKLLPVCALVLATLFVVAVPAGAREGDNPRFASKEAEECHKQLEDGKAVDDCQKAPSPIIPAKNELIWGVISFLALLGALYKFAWPGLKKGMEGRSERIRHDLDAADGQRAEASQILAQYQAQLADAKNESARIIEESRQTADAMKRDLAARADADIAQMRQRAAADIEAAKVQAIADLRGEVASLAIGAAEQVVNRNLDRDTNVALVEDYINRVGASR